MSDIIKANRKPQNEPEVDIHTRKSCLETAIFNITREHPFHGGVLQSLNISFTNQIPTAGVRFDSNGRKWEMVISPHFFCNKLSAPERIAVLLHEFYHITHKHPFRAPFIKIHPDRRSIMNIAMDIAINQYIRDLPDGCPGCKDQGPEDGSCTNDLCPGKACTIERFYNEETDGNKDDFVKSWTNKTWEFYYERLIEKIDKEKESDDSDGNGQGNGSSTTKDKIKEFDDHQWDSNATEQDMMDATEELVKRVMQKQGLGYDNSPKFVQDLLADIEARRSQLNYKELLLLAIKRHASGIDREYSWTRKSRRFGTKSPGTRIGNLPQLYIYIDTSGSMSVQEVNDFLSVVDDFLKIGSRKCFLGLWHTNLYSVEPYKIGDRLSSKDIHNRIQSGGTEVGPVLQHIYETQPDMGIICTDGCYSNVDFESFMKPGEQFPTTLWVISKDGMDEHPISRLGETVKIPHDGIEIGKDM